MSFQDFQRMGNPTVAAPAIPGEKPVGDKRVVGAWARIAILTVCMAAIGPVGLLPYWIISKVFNWSKVPSFGGRLGILLVSLVLAGTIRVALALAGSQR